MMKFMLMLSDDERVEQRTPEEMAAIMGQHAAVFRDLQAEGKYVESRRLRPSREATTLRGHGAARTTLDGPFAESKEVLGGYYLIECDSKAEAISWAERLPAYPSGAIEVRPARTGAVWRGPINGAGQYMIMFIVDESAQAKRSRAEIYRDIDTHYELSLPLAAQGRFVCSRSLEASAAASTLRMRDGRRVVTDGPFAESKEVVAGYFVIACDSRAEALEWAGKLQGGCDAVEVRPVWQMS
jgi:hypothetical protein